MIIDRIEEIRMINRVNRKIRESNFKIDNETLVLNICPEQSSIFCQNLIHDVGGNTPLPMFPIETYEDGNYKGYELNFLVSFKEYASHYKKFILAEVNVKTGNNYIWIINCLHKDFGIEKERILTTALVENKDSIFKVDVFDKRYEGNAKFTWNLKQNYV